MTVVEKGQNDSMGTKEGVALAAGWDDLISLTERTDESGWGTWETTSSPVVSLTPEKPVVVLPSLPSLAMVVYQPPVDVVPESSATVLPEAATSMGKSDYPISALGNFIHFVTLSNDEIVCLIEDYGVIFHTTEHKITQII
jgi:hypothetical protein